MNLTCVAKYSLLLAGLILLVPVYATAADDKKNKVQQQNAGQVAALPRQVVNMSNRLIYHPPPRGVPVSRVSGASRSPQGRLILEVLASLHTGLTLQEQPNLYWYLSRPVHTQVALTLIDEDEQAIQPLLEFNLDPPVHAGIHHLRLSDHGIKLQPYVVYQWSVALVPDLEQRSYDIIAKGTIQRIEPSRSLHTKLVQARKQDLPFIYANAGVWYDAIASICELIEARPDDQALREQRASLLEQVELLEVALYDKRRLVGGK